MTANPTVFSNHYYTELLNGGGAFKSDKTLLSDPETALWVRHSRHYTPPLHATALISFILLHSVSDRMTL